MQQTIESQIVSLPDQLLTYSDLSKILQRAEITIRNDVMRRKIPFLKIGKSVRFDLKQIQKWLESKRIPERGCK